MDEIILAYMAGVLDGDGSFGIRKQTQNMNPTYAPMVQLANRSVAVIELFKDSFGGSRATEKPKMTKSGELGRGSNKLVITKAVDVKILLEAIIPYLKIKKDRAKYLLGYINQFPFQPNVKLSNEVIAAKEKSYVAMKQFNDWTTFNNTITSRLARENTDDQEVYAYIAGLMDTDGSFSIKKQVKNKGTHVVNARYLPVISLSFTDTRAINYIRENCYLGKMYVPKNKSCSNGFHYQFGIYTKNECAQFIRLILPYLISKEKNAKVLLDFCENSKNTGYCKAGIPKEEIEFRDLCYRKLVSLNKYGVYKSPLIDLESVTGNADGNKGQAGQPCSLNAVSVETP